MATHPSLVVNAGRIQQLQPGDTVLNGLNLGRRNIIINGNFDIWQIPFVSGVFPGASDARIADMWDFRCFSSSGGVTTVSHETSVLPTIAQSNTYSSDCVKIATSTATTTVSSTDQVYLYARIEGYNWRILAQRKLTLSFWVRSSLTGIFCATLRNTTPGGSGLANNSYIAQYTINSANTWEKKTIQIPASPSAASTWVYDNTGGVDLVFTLVCGLSHQGGTGSWVTDPANSEIGTTNQVNFLASTSNLIYFSQVQLETGDIANPFELQPWQDQLALCQRYYAQTYAYGIATATVTNVGAVAYRTTVAGVHSQNQTWVYPVIMRVAPTLTYFAPAGGGGGTWQNITRARVSGLASSDIIDEHSVIILNPQVSGDAVGGEIAIHATADARFAFAP